MRKKVNIGVQVEFIKTIDGKWRVFLQLASKATHCLFWPILGVVFKSFVKKSPCLYPHKKHDFDNSYLKSPLWLWGLLSKPLQHHGKVAPCTATQANAITFYLILYCISVITCFQLPSTLLDFPTSLYDCGNDFCHLQRAKSTGGFLDISIWLKRFRVKW